MEKFQREVIGLLVGNDARIEARNWKMETRMSSIYERASTTVANYKTRF